MPAALRDIDTLMTAARALARSRQGVLPVVDHDGAYRRVVSAHAVAEALADGEQASHHPRWACHPSSSGTSLG